MKKTIFFLAVILLLSLLLYGCNSNEETGTLQFYANGEDFVREGLVSSDGWQIEFDHVYVTLANIEAYQTDPPYNAETDTKINSTESVKINNTYTVDLAEGEQNADPIFVAEIKEAPVGHYNAISWSVVNANDGVAKGYSLVIIGQATKEDETIDFQISIDEQISYKAGEYIGDERKGFVKQGEIGELEMTFHFDHIFGDYQLPADDDLNQSALGFQVFANLADNGKLVIDMPVLAEELSAENYNKLVDMVFTLGHVGEGHAHSEKIN